MNIFNPDEINAMKISYPHPGSEKTEEEVKDCKDSPSSPPPTTLANFEALCLEILIELPKSCYFTQEASSEFTVKIHYEGLS